MPSKTANPEAIKNKAAQKLRSSKVFDAAYTQLNPAQKQAVETLEGPVMVVAGPGTGKTQVIAMRTANILRKTQMRPSNILCLTFSVSGATAMRERLRSLIGADAYGITVKNFHGFCNDLISEYPVVFESWSALEQISDVERYRSINKIIDELLPDLKIVNPKNPYRRTREIIGRISQLKREGVVNPDQLEKIAVAYEEEMASKSKEGTKAHEKNLLTARKFREFLQIFQKYQEMLQETQRYDYEDMILFVLEALKEEEWLLQSLQERYQYILVDEFQDTNGAQYQLIDALTTYPMLDHQPNVCVVGDDDQAIYRFQGANLANILAFHERFPDAPTIALTTSYRCTQSILDAAGSLISHNTERLVGKIDGLEKDLTTGREGESAAPRLIFSPSDVTETWMLADLIQEKLDAGTEPNQIAVLVQKNAELQPIYDTLFAREIPVQMSGKVDLLAHLLVQQTIAILRAIESPRDNGKLAAALACECFDCHPADLGRLFGLLRGEQPVAKSLSDLLLMLNEDGNLDSEIHNSQFTIHNFVSILKARDVILDLSSKLGSRTVVDTMEHVLKDTGLLPKPDEQNPADFAALQTLFERIKYRAYEQPTFTFASFLSDLTYYETPEYSELRLSYDLPHLTESGVQLMTAHQSKGLEFDCVILANFRHGQWDKKRTPSSLAIPEDLLFGWEKDTKTFEKGQDERRVAFVAMTRARNELIFTCPKQATMGDSLRDVSPSAFFAEAGDLLEEARDLTAPEQTSTLLFEPIIQSDEAFRAFLKERLQHFALSVTALNHYLEDPQLFIELDLLQMPQSKEASLVYGNAVHEALRVWGMNHLMTGEENLKSQSSNLTSFVESFKTYLDEREVLTEAEKARLIAVGEEALPRYFEQRLAEANPHVYRVEYGITTLLADESVDPDRGGVPIKGKIDRIDTLGPDSAVATVVDYKTGRPKTEKQIYDDGYFRQLSFYSLLIEHGASILKPQSFVLDFIGEGSEHPVERAFEVSEADRKELVEIVKEVWKRVINLDFSPINV